LPDRSKFFQEHFAFQTDAVGYFHGRPQAMPVATGGMQGQCSQKFFIHRKFLCP